MDQLSERLKQASQKLKECDKNFILDLTRITTELEVTYNLPYVMGCCDCRCYIRSYTYPQIQSIISKDMYNLLKQCPNIRVE